MKPGDVVAVRSIVYDTEDESLAVDFALYPEETPERAVEWVPVSDTTPWLPAARVEALLRLEAAAEKIAWSPTLATPDDDYAALDAALDACRATREEGTHE